VSTDDRTPITGPIPIYVETIPSGVALDMEALTRLVVADVLENLLGEDTSSWDRLQELAQGTTASDTRLPFEELVETLVEATSSKVPLYGTKALELAQRLARAAGVKPVPQQLRRAS